MHRPRKNIRGRSLVILAAVLYHRCVVYKLYRPAHGGIYDCIQIQEPADVYPAAAGGAAAAAHRRTGPERDHRSGRYPDGLVGGRSRRFRRQPCGQLQHPDDPGDERPCHRRCRGHQPVHRPSGAEGRQAGRCADPVHSGQLQQSCDGGGRGGAARHPAGHLRLHRRRRHALR